MKVICKKLKDTVCVVKPIGNITYHTARKFKEVVEQQIRNQENMVLNITELLLPLIKKLEQTNLTEVQKSYLSLIGSTIHDITSPFYRTLSGKYFGLTPMEIKVADLIRNGKTTKEIAELLGNSIRAIEFHRHNIRKKIKIDNTSTSLKSALSEILIK